jgi:hypothetical protein
MRAAAAAAIVEALKVNSSLQKLDLVNNKIDSAGAVANFPSTLSILNPAAA